MTKMNHIKLPSGPEKVKENKKGHVFVKQMKKGNVHQKSRGEYVPYDIQKGMRVDGEAKSEIDEKE